jgi:alpha-beta hydrolase superfamily lysophospholipase
LNPFYFGTAARSLFGSYHAPARTTRQRGAVVICNPLGAEYIEAHRGLRLLAGRLSEAGFHVLRMDYFGTGDSGGNLEDVTLDDCVADIGAAVDELSAMSGCPRVRLVGLRLGATLAARAATRLGDRVEALVLWEPVISGERHWQEFLLNSFIPTEALLAGTAKIARRPDLQGFPVSEVLAAQIRAVDLGAAAKALPSSTFVVTCVEETLPALRTALASADRNIALEAYPSFPFWIENWPMSVPPLPVAAIDRIVDWLATVTGTPGRACGSIDGSEPVSSPDRAAAVPDYTEEPVRIGAAPQMVGILTTPARADAAGDRPAILMINTGIAHRADKFRKNVLLARCLARQGHVVLRFDLSGIGDSDRRNDSLHPVERARDDVLEAVAFLKERHGQRRIVLLGLCSGADIALVAGGADPHVVGVILLDPSIPPTTRSYLRFLAKRLVRVGSLWNAALHPRRFIGNLRQLGTGIAVTEAAVVTVSLRDPAVKQFLSDRFSDLVAAGNRIMVVVTSDQQNDYYRTQLLDAFPDVAFGDLLTLRALPGCDHLFTTARSRKELFAMVTDWCDQTAFRAPPPLASRVLEEVEYF